MRAQGLIGIREPLQRPGRWARASLTATETETETEAEKYSDMKAETGIEAAETQKQTRR